MPQFVRDTFTGTAGVAIDSRSGETGASWTKHTGWGAGVTPVISDANRARSAGGTAPMWASGSPLNADYDVTGIIYVASTLSQQAAILGRVDTSFSNWYELRLDTSTSPHTWTLRKYVNGTPTTIATYQANVTAGATITAMLRMRGTAITGWLDGVQQLSATDSAHSSAGKAGFYAGNTSVTNSTGLHFDELKASDPGVEGGGVSALRLLSARATGSVVRSVQAKDGLLRFKPLAGPGFVRTSGGRSALRLLSLSVGGMPSVGGITGRAALRFGARAAPEVFSPQVPDYEWIGPDGVVTPLTTHPNLLLLWGQQGFGMAPHEFVRERADAGEVVTYVRAEARELDVPILVTAGSEPALRTVLTALAHEMNPTRGIGALRLTNVGAPARDIPAYLLDGLSGDDSEDAGWVGWRRLVLTFLAPSPYWRDAEAFEATFTVGTPARFFPVSGPWLPIRLSNSAVLADVALLNAGAVPVYPVWEIGGPGEVVVIRNLNTGAELRLTRTIGAGEVVTIDTSPRAKSVRLNDGSNLFSGLSLTSDFWALPAGTTVARIELAGASSASYVTVSYRQEYHRP